MSAIRENWRVGVLVILLVLSGVALFAPGMATPETRDNTTNLQYGLDLSGGARVRATPVGLMAADLGAVTDVDEAEETIAAELDLEPADVEIYADTREAEVYADIERSAFRSALEAAGAYGEETEIRQGVTDQTIARLVDTLQSKIDATGFQAATVQTVESSTSERTFVVIEAANSRPEEIRDLLESRGVVRMVAYYPAEGNQTRTTVLTFEELRDSQIGLPDTTQQGQHHVPITLSDEVAPDFAQDMRNYGFTTNQAYSSQCNQADLQPGNYCLLTVRDNRTVYSAVMAEGLGSQIATGEFEKDPRFIITATNASEARQLYVDMRAGSLPTRLTIQDTFFVDPSLGTEFRGRSFLTGLVAVLAVSLVVFFRYGEFKVAFPMLVTALSEVAILLGFAATVPLALNLSHIAGLIAVIGTGVDDLIIIADEVMTEEVSSDRVFRNRFRKALWIIGAAAATTIIAMSPLAVLSLGDLRGFAIVTILGVLIGVIITRPAYGDILRRLLTDQH